MRSKIKQVSRCRRKNTPLRLRSPISHRRWSHPASTETHFPPKEWKLKSFHSLWFRPNTLPATTTVYRVFLVLMWRSFRVFWNRFHPFNFIIQNTHRAQQVKHEQQVLDRGQSTIHFGWLIVDFTRSKKKQRSFFGRFIDTLLVALSLSSAQLLVYF